MLCRHGVTHTLDQIFNAPLLIKKIMNDESGITRAFIGTEYGPVSASHTSCSCAHSYVNHRMLLFVPLFRP